eukprot:g2568.t1
MGPDGTRKAPAEECSRSFWTRPGRLCEVTRGFHSSFELTLKFPDFHIGSKNATLAKLTADFQSSHVCSECFNGIQQVKVMPTEIHLNKWASLRGKWKWIRFPEVADSERVPELWR